MSVFEVASDRWSCVGASRTRRAWHSRWIGGTGRAPHRWVARQADRVPLASDRSAYRLKLTCVACDLQDEVTHVSAAAVLASGVQLTPLARESVGLAPAVVFKEPVVFHMAASDANMLVIGAKSAHRPWRRTKAIGRGAFWLLEAPWRFALWPARRVLQVVTAPARAVRAWWRWVRAENSVERFFGPLVIVGFSVAFLGMGAGLTWHDVVTAPAQYAQRCQARRAVGVIESVRPNGSSLRAAIVRLTSGLEYEASHVAGDPLLAAGLPGYLCENGHFHYEPPAPPAPAAPARLEDF